MLINFPLQLVTIFTIFFLGTLGTYVINEINYSCTSLHAIFKYATDFFMYTDRLVQFITRVVHRHRRCHFSWREIDSERDGIHSKTRRFAGTHATSYRRSVKFDYCSKVVVLLSYCQKVDRILEFT
jgi:hypothetical protein